jgi:hypothetical protein
VADARARLAQDLRVAEADIRIIDRSKRMQEGSFELKPKRAPYIVEIAPLHCSLSLHPTPSQGLGRVLTRKLTIDRTALKTVNDLIETYFPRLQFRNSVTIFLNGSHLDGEDQLSKLPAGALLSADYPAPREDAAYFFVDPERTREKVRSVFDRSVLDLKCHFLEQQGRVDCLPNVLKMDFWGMDLLDNDRFGSLLLPEEAEITVSRNEAKRVKVRLLDGSDHIFMAGDSDSVSTLKIFVGRAMSMSPREFVLRSSTGDVNEALRICDFPDLSLTAVCSSVQFEFDSADGRLSLHLRPGATILDGRQALSAALGRPLEAVLLLAPDGSSPPDDVPLSNSGLRISCLREMTFIFDSRPLTIPVDFDSPTSTIKAVLSARFRVPASDLRLLFGGSEIKEDLTLNDIEASPSAPIMVTAESAAPPPCAIAPRAPYRFITADRREQTLYFESGTKILDARQRLARALDVPEDAVSLLFAGIALKDTFLLRKIRFGNDAITVCVRDESPVLLVTDRQFGP